MCALYDCAEICDKLQPQKILKLLESKSGQICIFLTQSMELLGKLLQDLQESETRTSKSQLSRHTTLQHKEESKQVYNWGL